MRSRKCKVCAGWHDLEQPWPDECAGHYARRAMAASAPMVIPDSMSDTRHPVTQRVHDSKSAFRRDTRAAGCVEVGNDAPLQSKPEFNMGRRAGYDIAESIRELRARG